MTTILPDNTYCAGDLITERLTVNQTFTLNNIDVHNIDADIVNAESFIGTDVNADLVTSSSYKLNNEDITTWQELIDKNYITIPSPPSPPTPEPDTSTITRGVGVLYDDLNNSTDKIISSNPNIKKLGGNPYSYCYRTISRDYQQPIIETQYDVVTYVDQPGYIINSSTIGTHNHSNPLMVNTPDEPDTTVMTYHNNHMLPIMEDDNGFTYSNIYSDTPSAITIDNTSSTLLGVATLYTTTTPRTAYTVIIRKQDVYINIGSTPTQLFLGSTNEAVSAFKYARYDTDDRMYYNTDLVIISTINVNESSSPYWNIIIIRNGEVIVNRNITDSDKHVSTMVWGLKTCYPCAMYTHDHNTLLISIQGNNNGTSYVEFYTLNINNPSSALSYVSCVTGIEAYVGRKFRYKVFFQHGGYYAFMLPQWNYEYLYPSYENYNGSNLSIIMVRTTDTLKIRYVTRASLQQYAHNIIGCGLVLPYPIASVYNIVVYKMDDQNYDTITITISSDTELTIASSSSVTSSLPFYNGDARFTSVDTTQEEQHIYNNLRLFYCNWTPKSPYIVYCTSTPGADLHSGTYRWYITHYQLFNINQGQSSSTYPVPSWMTDNKCLCSNGKIYSL